MIGEGYDEPSAVHRNKRVGLAKARSVPVTSSNSAFAANLATLGMTEDNLKLVERQHHDLRAEWLDRYRLTQTDLESLRKWKRLNGLISILHYRPFANINVSITESFPPQEPEKSLDDNHLFQPIRWLLGDELYRRKIAALSRAETYADADRKTKFHPLTKQILSTISSEAKNQEGASQNYEYVAVRLLDGIVGGQRAILASPLYLALEPFSWARPQH
jgi:hypothetical protein